ncbi:hypothetical protein M0208_10445 [Sphingomonas sp. SUN019]|uniref:hypothetical protein n=1 Tax=Sphingomonas sp. SUN019 TaxID=2937788 RepID=UPI0021643A34|nr:hypothetical protein [Sphingomonas sp. SUN019]UVO50914.1 hypothetical protein M0208_10445 [Sphingomonas sp. SUN019]
MSKARAPARLILSHRVYWGDQTITLGGGTDVLTLDRSYSAFAIGNPTRVTDFATGADTLSIDQYLADALVGWDKATNPFATGRLKLVRSGSDTLLRLDRDGSAGTGYALDTLLTFANTIAASFTAKDLGYAPVSSLATTLTTDAGALEIAHTFGNAVAYPHDVFGLY